MQHVGLPKLPTFLGGSVPLSNSREVSPFANTV